MSIYFAVKYADEIQIMSDGASWDETGTLVQVGSKVHEATTLPMVVTGRGDVRMFDGFAKNLIAEAESAGSVDRAVAGLVEALPLMATDVGGMIESSEAHFEMLVAGYSETRGLFMCFFDTVGADRAAYTLEEREVAFGTVPLGPELGRRFLTGITMADPRFFRQRGAEVMDVVRLLPLPEEMPWGGSVKAKGAMAGGFCELVTVRRDGISRQVLKDYGDPIGEAINPYREYGNVAPIGNRHERRRAAREAREREPGKTSSRQ